MGSNVFRGVLLAAVSGLVQGAILVPLKFARTWRWENTWIVFSAAGYFFLPWVFAALTVPSLISVYTDAEYRSILTTSLFGVGWGVSAVLFGLGCNALGMALGFATILGLGTTAGSLLPLVLQHRSKLWEPEGIKIIAGVTVMLFGVIICSYAGKLRDDARRVRDGVTEAGNRQSFLVGLLLCIVSGILNPLINFALAFGSDLTRVASAKGATPESALNVLWTLIGTAAFIPNAIYCMYLLRKNRTAGLLWRAEKTLLNYFMALVMGLLWMGGIAIYGRSTHYLGDLGPSLGWPIFMASLIVTSNLFGILMGEWQVGGRAISTMYVGLVVMVGSVFIIGG